MEKHGWLKGRKDPAGGARARKDYRLTAKGRQVLDHVREQLEELYDEVVGETSRKKSGGSRYSIRVSAPA